MENAACQHINPICKLQKYPSMTTIIIALKMSESFGLGPIKN